MTPEMTAWLTCNQHDIESDIDSLNHQLQNTELDEVNRRMEIDNQMRNLRSRLRDLERRFAE